MPNRPPGRIAYPAKVLFGSIGESLSLTGPASQLSTNSCTWEWKCQRGEQCNAAERRSTSWRFLVYGPQSTGTTLRTRQLLDLYPPAQARTIRLHDIVSIRVDESATALLLGNATSRKTTSYDAVVRDWIRMVGLDTIKPAPQSDGDPRVQINENEVYRGDSTLRTSETITFNIAAQVVDILPNGLIVLEGNTTISLNDNSMEVSLIGTCRSEDIQPDNTVLSRNLVNKHIKKREDGHVRDGYARGWLTRLFAKVRPF